MNHLTVDTDDTFASLLELAANNDVEGFKRSIKCNPSGVDEIGLWYDQLKGSKQMVNLRTPLMVAATHGSIDVIRLILSQSDADVNRFSGNDYSTALHCATSGGAVNADDVVKLLLAAGADPNLVDANGHRPIDVIVPPKFQELNEALMFSTSEKKEYPIDPSLPDIKNSIYSTDEFRMYSFKVRPCSRAYSHDWTECPFVHPEENARRRDPRKFHYSCVPCPDFREGACRRGDMCEYAHGVFECWLHPAQYRTRLCKDGKDCDRRVCFFAHTVEELRPLYASTGSAVPSPRSGTSANDSNDSNDGDDNNGSGGDINQKKGGGSGDGEGNGGDKAEGGDGKDKGMNMDCTGQLGYGYRCTYHAGYENGYPVEQLNALKRTKCCSSRLSAQNVVRRPSIAQF